MALHQHDEAATFDLDPVARDVSPPAARSTPDDWRRRARDPLDVNRDVHPILAAIADRSWIDDAVCKGRSDLFFGPTGERPTARRRREHIAKALCAQCPVLEPCRASARRNHENGLWGGETEVERALAGHAPRGILRREVARARLVGLRTCADQPRPLEVLVALDAIEAEAACDEPA